MKAALMLVCLGDRQRCLHSVEEASGVAANHANGAGYSGQQFVAAWPKKFSSEDTLQAQI